MLAKANRIVTASDYRRLVRTGRKARSPLALAYGSRSGPDAPLRVGVIVARSVGNAVVRNRVRRRVKAVSWSLAQEVRGLDVVLRALPTSAAADFASIDREVRRLVRVLEERA
ncbi:ribonuclease P protein component [uncultured Amnibacterium sp.]|uniref:ribonuclease P protein component n=1 Tax=uncultured Amnibacterium sp. TaxID=1631851 RepID=UPI0035CB680C